MDSELSSTDSAPPPCIDKLRDDFICTICLNIFFEPVTVSCGHTFCRKCLLLAMDKYNKNCPVCRHWIYISKENFPNVSIVMWNTIQALFPQDVEARKQTSSSIDSQEAPNTIVETDDNPVAQPNGNMASRILPIVENVIRREHSQSRGEIRPNIENEIRRELSQPDTQIRLLFQNEIRRQLSQPDAQIRLLFQNEIRSRLSQPDTQSLLRLALEELSGAFSQLRTGSSPPPPPSSS